MANRAIDADQIASAIVDDGIERHRRFARLPVADDQLALSAADGDHAVDRLETGGHRLTNPLAGDHSGGQALDGRELCALDRAFVVDGFAQGVDHSANQRFADRHTHDFAAALDLIALAQLGVVAQKHAADLILFEVHGQAVHAVGKLQHLARHHLVQAVETGNAVAERDDCAYFVDLNRRAVILNLLFQDLRDFFCLDLRHSLLPIDS